MRIYLIAIVMFCVCCNMKNKDVIVNQPTQNNLELEVTFASSFKEDTVSVNMNNNCSLGKERILNTYLIDGVTSFQFAVYLTDVGYEVKAINDKAVIRCNIQETKLLNFEISLNQSIFDFQINSLEGKYILFFKKEDNLFFEQYKTQPFFY